MVLNRGSAKLSAPSVPPPASMYVLAHGGLVQLHTRQVRRHPATLTLAQAAIIVSSCAHRACANTTVLLVTPDVLLHATDRAAAW